MRRAATASSLHQCHCDRRRQFTRAQLNSALIRPTSTDSVIVTSEKTTSDFKGSYRSRSRGCSDKEAFKLLGKINGVDMLATEARYESCNYVRHDGHQHHQTGCSGISVGAMTEWKAAQRRLRHSSSSSCKLDKVPVNYAHWRQQRYKLTLKIATKTYTVNTATQNKSLNVIGELEKMGL